MRYPKRLLPKRRYKIINVDKFPNDTYLLRKSECEQIQIEKSVDPKCIAKNPDHWVNGLSSSLLGVFRKKDIGYITKEEAWEHCAKIKKQREINFDYIESSIPIYLSVKSIHNKTFPYEHSDRVKLENKHLQKISGNRVLYNRLLLEKFTGSCKVIHKPTLGNFWHFEIIFKDDRNNFISNEVMGVRKIVKSFIQSFIIKSSTYSLPINYKKIHRKLYDPYTPCFLQKFFLFSSISH